MSRSQLHLATSADICQIKALTLHSHQVKYAGSGENLAAQAIYTLSLKPCQSQCTPNITSQRTPKMAVSHLD
ncbi:hypothetical protein [Piscirickettsia salmonis]|uniref:hypothetical protein n=1 Tax=Piscirickettsia salmonis TaxID=1238 RepID=UPI0007D773CA|nr:hypothetical protein A0O36_01229 [Piscirickettsiaceae bacterium NZ-RLO1]